MSIYLHKSQNVSILLYHIVCPTKYRRVVFSDEVDNTLKETCLGIAERYEMQFLEIGVDKNHAHFLVQSVPSYSPTKIVRVIKSITAREIFRRVPLVRKQLWGGEFWGDGYFINTVGRESGEEGIRKYIQNQGQEEEYKKLHYKQLKLF